MGVARRAAARARRWARRQGGTLLRRIGALPEGMPDGLGDDARLRQTVLPQRVFVYYSETRTNLYQLRQWYEPLRALDRVHPVVLVLADSRVAAVVEKEAGLPHVVVARSATLDHLVASGDVALFLYVGHHPGNFTAMRVTTAVHVYLSHGESDKRVSVSNQIKAYDYAFVAGQGAIDRLQDNVILFDAAAHLVPIGRPQLDYLGLEPAGGPVPDGDSGEPGARGPRGAGDRVTVLYAPTWEGGQGTVAYSSILSHGVPLVRALLADDRFRVVYRPHPRTGISSTEYLKGSAAVAALVEQAAAADPAVGHRVDAAPSPQAAFADADVLVADVSAMPMDWLASGRPLLITVPQTPTAVAAATRLLRTVPRLDLPDLADVADRVYREAVEDPSHADRLALVDYYFGDTTPGVATRRFVEACTTVIATRDVAVAALPDGSTPGVPRRPASPGAEAGTAGTGSLENVHDAERED